MPDVRILSISQLETTWRLDPEYYSSRNDAMAVRLSRFKTRDLDSLSDRVADGIHSSPDIDESGILYLSGKALGFNSIQVNGALRINSRQHLQNRRSALKSRDVLITTVGHSIGNCGVVTEDLLPANIDRHLGLIRLDHTGEVDCWFLSAFLNSRYGRFQSRREQTGSAQPNLFIEKLKCILIPELECASEVSRMTEQAYRVRNTAHRRYIAAERKMMERLGWQRPAPLKLAYEARRSHFRACGRMDAEFYRPEEAELRNVLSREGAVNLGKIATITRGVSPTYEDGDCYVVNSQDLGPWRIDYGALAATSRTFYESDEARPGVLEPNDVLTYATGAYLGRTNTWISSARAVAGVDVIITRIHSDAVPSAYCGLFLNSEAGQFQLRGRSVGSGQQHIYPRQIKNVLVFAPPTAAGEVDEAWMAELAREVEEATVAETEANKMLMEAAAAIDGEIGGAERGEYPSCECQLGLSDA